MAKRRMLDTRIIESDKFLSLSASSQALYIHLNMNADDDGFVDMWKNILRCMRAKRIHLDSLIEAGYVIEIGEDLLLISDWLLHNKIRSDRYVVGRYKNELDTIQLLPTGRYIKA